MFIIQKIVSNMDFINKERIAQWIRYRMYYSQVVGSNRAPPLTGLLLFNTSILFTYLVALIAHYAH